MMRTKALAQASALLLGAVSALTGLQAASLAYSFTSAPADGVIAGAAGQPVGWGYHVTNSDPTHWLVFTNLSADSFQSGTPDASVFDFPILGPTGVRDVEFDDADNLGLYRFTWDSGVAAGTENSGSFTIGAEWWSDDPLTGGVFVQEAKFTVLSYRVILDTLSTGIVSTGIVGTSIVGTSIVSTSIDLRAPYYLASAVGIGLTPAFEGGTLRVNATGDYPQRFSVNSLGGTIDSNALTSTFSGEFFDLDPNHGGALRITSDIAGGTVILSGDSSYTGGTTVASGATLQLGNGGTTGSIIGNVFADGTLVFNRSDVFTFAGDVAGHGKLVKTGTGTLNLSGSIALAGGALVQQGTLFANGNLGAGVTIASTGTLRGTGRIAGPVAVSGTLAPGNSPGALTTEASVTMNAGSVFREEIDGLGTGNGAGNYSRLLVLGAGSRFVANGTLVPVLRGIAGEATNGFTPALGNRFRIVTAQGGIAGRFAFVAQPVGLADGTRLDAFYDIFGSRSVELYVTPASYSNFMDRAGINANGTAAGRALDELRAQDAAGRSSVRQDELRYLVAGLGASHLPQVVLSLAGEVHGAAAAAAAEPGRWLQDSLGRQLAGTRQTANATGTDRTLWLDINASQGRSEGDAFASAFSVSRYQLALGAEVLRAPTWQVGLGLSYADSRVSPRSGSATIEETLPFVYGQYVLGGAQPVFLDGLLAYGFGNWRTDRIDPIGPGNLSTNAQANLTLLGLAIRSPFVVGGFVVEPFGRLLWQRVERSAVNEGMASLAALDLEHYDATGTRVLIGVAAVSPQRDPFRAPMTYRISLAVGNDFGDLVYPTVGAELASAGLDISTPNVGRTFGQIDLVATFRLTDSVYGFVDFQGTASKNAVSGAVTAGLNLRF